jgi:hypothetical protein
VILNADQIVKYAYDAGYRGLELAAISAIALAESGGNTQAHNAGTPGHPENSYGVLQINLAAHPQYTIAQVTDPAQAFKIAYSDFGSQFSQWTTYTGGQSASYLVEVGTAIARMLGSASSPPSSGIEPAQTTYGAPVSGPTPQQFDPLAFKSDVAAVTNGGGGSGVTPVVSPAGVSDALSGISDISGTIGSSIKDAFSPIADLIKWLLRPEHWWRIFFVAGGSALFIVGISIYLRPEPSDIASLTPQGAALKAVA